MTPELAVLAYAALLQGLQLVLMSTAANLDLGPAKTMSARDQSRLGGPLLDQLSDKPARLFRAFNNMFEALILYTIAVVLVTLTDTGSGFTALCAYAFLVARVAYIPAYYYGWRPWRSLIWMVGLFATYAMIGATLWIHKPWG